jgi:hypothetical protein
MALLPPRMLLSPLHSCLALPLLHEQLARLLAVAML